MSPEPLARDTPLDVELARKAYPDVATLDQLTP
jgi:hypothetical protein